MLRDPLGLHLLYTDLSINNRFSWVCHVHGVDLPPTHLLTHHMSIVLADQILEPKAGLLTSKGATVPSLNNNWRVLRGYSSAAVTVWIFHVIQPRLMHLSWFQQVSTNNCTWGTCLVGPQTVEATKKNKFLLACILK